MKRQSQQILADATGHSMEEIERDTDRDRIFTPEEAVGYGLADHIVSRDGV